MKTILTLFLLALFAPHPVVGQELQGHVVRVSNGMLFLALEEDAVVKPGDRFQIFNGNGDRPSTFESESNGSGRVGTARIITGTRGFARAELTELEPGVSHASLVETGTQLWIYTFPPEALASITVSTSPLLPSGLPGITGPDVMATRTNEPPKIDGRLDDPVWQSATPIEGFLQREPIEGDPSSESTEARILVDDDRIYIGFRCYDSDPSRIVASRMQRDSELDDDDNVSVIFDTYNDRRGGFYFATNALGAQYDMLLSDEGRTRNSAWDCIWQTRSSQDADGWSAEMAIDLDQLRYRESDDAIWGLNLARTIKRKNEETFITPPPLDYGFRGQYRTSTLGTLRGLGELRQKPRFQITPFTLGGTDREFDGLDPTEQPTLEAGVDLKYGLTPSLTLDLSYNCLLYTSDAADE